MRMIDMKTSLLFAAGIAGILVCSCTDLESDPRAVVDSWYSSVDDESSSSDVSSVSESELSSGNSSSTGSSSIPSSSVEGSSGNTVSSSSAALSSGGSSGVSSSGGSSSNSTESLSSVTSSSYLASSSSATITGASSSSAVSSSGVSSSIGSSSSSNEAPVMENQSFSVVENRPVGTLVGTLSASDAAGTVFTWTVLSASSSQAFTLNSTSGAITIKGSLDYETTKTYTLSVQVRDNGSPIKSDTGTVTITVTDSNDAPVILVDTFYVDANDAADSILGTVSASDQDAGSTIIYTLVSGNDDGYFSVNSANGVLTLVTEKPSKGSDFNLGVEASDGVLTDTANILVHVSDTGSFTDARDNQTYKWVEIGPQKWMAENLNYDTLDGTGSWCYSNTASYCDTYGRLYNWSTSMLIDSSYNSATWGGDTVEHQGICPDGWHVPTKTEWQVLVDYVNLADDGSDNSTEGTSLKADTSLWSSGAGTDMFEFSALPGGYYHGSSFDSVSHSGYWWTATEYSSTNAGYRLMYYNTFAGLDSDNYSKEYGLSIRCVKDSE